MLELFGDAIYVYTREQAINDGVLVDVTEMGKEAGFKVPVAVTCALHEIINTIPKSSCQDFEGRLWDVLYMGMVAAQNGADSDTLHYDLILTHGKKKNITLKMVISGGDNGEPVVTIMLPDED